MTEALTCGGRANGSEGFWSRDVLWLRPPGVRLSFRGFAFEDAGRGNEL